MAKIGTKKEEVVVFDCPVCREKVTGDMTFRITDKGTETDTTTGVVQLLIETKAVGLNVRHKCDLDTQEGPPESEPSSVSSLPDL